MSKRMLKMHTIKIPTYHVYCGTNHKSHIIKSFLSPSTNEWMDKMWYVYTMEYFNHEEEWNYVIFKKMDGSRDHYVKQISMTWKNKYHIFSDMWKLEKQNTKTWF
jgi:hypothetical protein